MTLFARLFLFPAALAVLPAPAFSQAADTEHREFTITVDGKEAGRSQMTITRMDDGLTVMVGQASLRVSQLLFPFRQDHQVTEWWKEGKLQALKSSLTENGKKQEVLITTEAGQMRLRANGQERTIKADVWTTTCWQLADPRFHNNAVPILDVVTGKESDGQLRFVKTDKVMVSGQEMECYHFRVTGGPYPADLWFDRYYRLVKQEFTEGSRHTVVQLVGIRR